jgi:hypothetical protein
VNCSPSGEPLENYDDEIIGHEFRILGTNERESGNHCLEQHDKVIEGQRQLVFGENCSTRLRIFLPTAAMVPNMRFQRTSLRAQLPGRWRVARLGVPNNNYTGKP